MKSIISTILAIAMIVIPIQIQADSTGMRPKDDKVEGQSWVAICVGVVVVAVAATVVYVVYKSAQCVKKQRCDNCGRILPANATVCPYCGEKVPPEPDSVQAQSTGSVDPALSNFVTCVEVSQDLVHWDEVSTLPNYQCNGDVQAVSLGSMEDFQAWMQFNGIQPSDIVTNYPLDGTHLFRIVER